MVVEYSICIAAYNAEKYIDECIKSVLNQTFSNFELIIVNDCSKDKTGEILNCYSKSDDRVKVFHNNENKGPFYSKLRAINNAKGKYLMFMDADDYYEIDAIKKIDRIFTETNTDLVIFNYREIYENYIKDRIRKKEFTIYDNENRNDFLLEVLTKSNYNNIWSKAIKFDKVKDKMYFSEEDVNVVRRGDDHNISLEIYKNIEKAVITDEVLYNYRINNAGLTRKQKKEYNFHFRNREKVVDFIKQEKCLKKEDIEQLNKHAVKKFENQLEDISNFEMTLKQKIELFNKIKQTSYYSEYIKNEINKYKNLITFLFKNNMYLLLVFICLCESKLIQIFKK